MAENRRGSGMQSLMKTKDLYRLAITQWAALIHMTLCSTWREAGCCCGFLRTCELHVSRWSEFSQ